MERARTIGRRTVAVLSAVACGVVLTACGSSGGSSPPSTSSQSAGANSPPPTGTSTVGSSTGAASGTPADAATMSAINRAYATFFASTSGVAQSQAALQHGDRFTATLRAQGSSSYANHSSASVDSARLSSPDVAAVTFTIHSGGSVLLSRVPGFAVRTAGRWQVAATTFCGLLQLEGDAPAACKDPTVTALPH